MGRMSGIIKATAKFQEAAEPIKQKPIIQIDRTALPNTIRSSLDSGRDNPFRPDGEIYKSADPIVDYYKYGPNQSRAQSPTDSQLLLNVGDSKEADKNNKTRRKKTKTKKEDGERRSCWRKWFCCCCCCKCWNRKADGGSSHSGGLVDRGKEEESDRRNKDTKQSKIVVLKDDAPELVVKDAQQVAKNPLVSVEFIGDEIGSDTSTQIKQSTTQKQQAKSSKCVIS